MPRSVARIRHLLQSFDFKTLFIQELGWNKHSVNLSVAVDDKSFTLQAIAEKRSMQVFEYVPLTGEGFPDSVVRRKIERQVAKLAREHIIIFTDAAKTVQKWQWVRRELSRPLACREFEFGKGQTGELLVQKIQQFAFELDEEDKLDLVEVAGRVRQAFDVDRVTKRFYERFKSEHTAFLAFIKGIKAQGDKEWYASLMLNRLMFIYFIQKKGFLDGDLDYLRNRLRTVQSSKGKDKFHSFYRYFLLRLFHEGLGQPKADRKKDLEPLLGEVPYLNGGLFDVHTLEEANPEIQIADEAFSKLFDFFDAYQWHLDDRPRSDDNEINPDVLGYVFEKYINKKQMGAYYTKEDITGYIARNTVIPFLFNAAEKKCAIAFQPDGAIWRLLRDDPDRYLYPAVGHSVFCDIHETPPRRLAAPLPLPPEISAGLNDVAKRSGWNKPAPVEFALPTETWREHVARRQRCLDLQAKLKAGEIHSINDLITCNLDVCQFAEDAIENCEGPETLRAFWKAIENVSVLDPTCGSGAFLFAALNILEPLYDACLVRMQAFVDDLEHSGQKHHPEKFSDFRKILAEVNNTERHPNHRYFVLKSIIINNLYGVDIMEEAVEICKLRLFLKMVAQVEKVKHLEPLPDIDFNVRAGNTLVGFVSLEDVKRSLFKQHSKNDTMRDMFDTEETETVNRIVEDAEVVDRAFKKFREMQTDHSMDSKLFSAAKVELRSRLGKLRTELDRYLAGEYRVDPELPKELKKWQDSHQPFHWFAEFYGIMHDGGFDVIVGNPPYVQMSALSDYRVKDYKCVDCGNLYAIVLERCDQLSPSRGRQGFIVPVSSISTDGYKSLQSILGRRWLCFSSYDDRPSRLFDGLEHIRLTIHLIGERLGSAPMFSTVYNKWSGGERGELFGRLKYVPSTSTLVSGTFPKLSSQIEAGIVTKLVSQKKSLSNYCARNGPETIYYSRKVGYFLQVLDFQPEVVDGQGLLRPPSEFKELRFGSEQLAKSTLCCLNSNLFYWFVTVFSDCRHVNKREVDAFPVNLERLTSPLFASDLRRLASALMSNLNDLSQHRTMRFKHDTLTVQCIIPKLSKPIIDEIDRVLAKHYGFTDEELDFIINYDIKYRMGQDAENDAE